MPLVEPDGAGRPGLYDTQQQIEPVQADLPKSIAFRDLAVLDAVEVRTDFGPADPVNIQVLRE